RYTYAGNNPLSYMDPSGFFLGKLGDFIKENIGTIINVGFALAAMPFIGGLIASTTTPVMNGGNFGQFIAGLLVGSATGAVGSSMAGSVIRSMGVAVTGFGSAVAVATMRGAMSGAFSGALNAAIYGQSIKDGFIQGAKAGAITGAMIGAYR